MQDVHLRNRAHRALYSRTIPSYSSSVERLHRRNRERRAKRQLAQYHKSRPCSQHLTQPITRGYSLTSASDRNAGMCATQGNSPPHSRSPQAAPARPVPARAPHRTAPARWGV
jgi:hypothetical protein